MIHECELPIAVRVGTTTVTCTTVDACGNDATCTFTVAVTGSIEVCKFYDANVNGVLDPLGFILDFYLPPNREFGYSWDTE